MELKLTLCGYSRILENSGRSGCGSSLVGIAEFKHLNAFSSAGTPARGSRPICELADAPGRDLAIRAGDIPGRESGAKRRLLPASLTAPRFAVASSSVAPSFMVTITSSP